MKHSVYATFSIKNNSSSSELFLDKVYADCSIPVAMSIINDVISDKNFIQSMNNDSATFCIQDCEDSYEVTEVPQMDMVAFYYSILSKTNSIANDIKHLHWGAKGKDFYSLHNLAGELGYCFSIYIDAIAELMVEKTGHVPNLNCCECQPAINNTEGMTFDAACEWMRAAIDEYVEELRCFQMCQSEDVKSMIDDWIRDLCKHGDYIIKRVNM